MFQVDDQILYNGQKGTIRKIHSDGRIVIRYSRENRGTQEWETVSESEIIPFDAAQMKTFAARPLTAQEMEDLERR